MSKQYYVTDYHYGLKLKEIFTGKPSKVLEPLKTAGAEQEKLKDLKHFSKFYLFIFLLQTPLPYTLSVSAWLYVN